MTLTERVAQLAATGALTDAQQARAVALGLLPPTAATQTARATATNRDALLAKVGPALTTNAAYLALASPTTAQNTAQIKALTREVSALARLVAAQLDSTTGT
jgi:hypothetical protein